MKSQRQNDKKILLTILLKLPLGFLKAQTVLLFRKMSSSEKNEKNKQKYRNTHTHTKMTIIKKKQRKKFKQPNNINNDNKSVKSSKFKRALLKKITGSFYLEIFVSLG